MNTVQAPRATTVPVPLLSPAVPDFERTIRLLGVAVIATAMGVTAAAFRGDGTGVNAFLVGNAGLAHPAAAFGERTASTLVLLTAIAGVVWRRWPLFLPAAAYVASDALARWHGQGHGHSDWVLLAHSARYIAPITVALLLLASRSGGAKRKRLAAAGGWGLRVALAAVFACHGAEALAANPVFIDLIVNTAANLTAVRVSDSAARTALEVIGTLDLAVAGVMLVRPGPVVLAWAAAWAGITALSRMTANGWGGYADVLVRASYYIGPVALWVLMTRKAAAVSPSDIPVPVEPGRSQRT